MSLGTVLVTGGTGSFGTAFIRHLLQYDLADYIVSVSRNAEMRYALEHAIPDGRLHVVPGDVRVLNDLRRCYRGDIQTIVHAAAEKHILTGEHHAHYVRAVNIDGAQNVINFAHERCVNTVIALSTDKACAPINEYGKSKAQAEALFTEANFTCVRYGNVAGSSGSVIPLFLQQQQQGAITVTDCRMTRFHMALSPASPIQVFLEPQHLRVMSAVELVLYAIQHGDGRDIFIPKIPSATVGSLAASFAGCTIKEIGIRAGEKMHEDLISADESTRCWDCGAVYVLADACPLTLHGQRVPVGFRYTSKDDAQPLVLTMLATA